MRSFYPFITSSRFAARHRDPDTGAAQLAGMTKGFSPIHRHCERSEAISQRLPRRSHALTPRNDGFSLVELSIVLFIRRLRSICHSVARLSLHLSSRFATRHRDPDTGAAKLAGMTAAFSLIELSIVLVILGLLTGGILTGQNLIRAAELRSVTTEFQAYQTAVNTFRDKYFALPGDMRNAHQFWGSAGGSGVIGDGCEAATGTGTQTCSGNGDGLMLLNSANQFGENFTFWQHLANAGLIQGNYTGVSGPAGPNDAFRGVNVPISKVGSTSWNVHPHLDWSGVNDPVMFAMDYGNNMILGADVATSVNEAPAFTPEEVWNIDTKMDDGKPGTGKISIRWWDTCTDASTNGHTNISDRLNANYLLTETSKTCAIYFPRAF